MTRCAPSSPTPRSLGYNDVTDGSRITFSTGMATILAARDAIKKLCRARRADLGHPGGCGDLGEGPRQAGRRQCRQLPAAVAQGDRRPGRRRPAARSPATTSSTPMAPASASPRTSAMSRSIRRPARTKIVRYTVLQDAGKAVHPSLCRGPVPGRRGAGHRLGAERGVHLRQGRPAAECRLPRLPHPGLLRPADDRHGDPGDSESRAIPTACAASARPRSCRRWRRSPTRSRPRPACA